MRAVAPAHLAPWGCEGMRPLTEVEIRKAFAWFSEPNLLWPCALWFWEV